MEYRIRRGDTLSGLAKRFGTTVPALASANGIRDVNRIREGNILLIPDKEETPPASKPETPKESGGLSAAPVLFQSEYDAMKRSGQVPMQAVVIPDPPPPPPPPDEPQAKGFDFSSTPLGKIHRMIDPVRVLSGKDEPTIADYLSTAIMGLGGEAPARGPAPRVEPTFAGDISPTPEMARRLASAIKARTRNRAAFDSGIDPLWYGHEEGMPPLNVPAVSPTRSPSIPGNLPREIPFGFKEIELLTPQEAARILMSLR
jgi:LysM repeat protein